MKIVLIIESIQQCNTIEQLSSDWAKHSKEWRSSLTEMEFKVLQAHMQQRVKCLTGAQAVGRGVA